MADNWVNITQEEAYSTIGEGKWVDITPEEGAESVTKEADSLVKRFGKQFYNMFVAQGTGGIIETGARGMRFGQYPIIGASGPYMTKEESLEYRELAKAGEEAGKAVTAKLAVEVPEAGTLGEKGVDIAAMVASTAAQIALLRRVMPKVPTPVIWETQNLMTGGTPGVGAAYGATLGGISKLPLKTVEKLGAETLSLYTLARISGEEPGEAAAMALVPAALRIPRVIRTGLRLRSTRLKTKGARPVKRGEAPRESLITSKARDLYDDLLKKAEAGDKKALKKLNTLTQGTNLPTYEQLLEKVNTGDMSATADIQAGNYYKGPNAGVASFEKEAARYYKIEPGTQVEKTPVPNTKAKIIDIKETIIPPVVPELEAVNSQLLEWSRTTKRLRATEVTEAIKALHRKQAARGTGILTKALRRGEPVGIALRKVKRGFSGMAQVPDVEAPKLSKAQKALYDKRILDIYPADNASVTFSREHMVHSLDKFLAGKIPTNAEFLALDKLFGRETTLQLYNNLASKRPLTFLQGLKFAVQLFKAPFAIDVQFARQGSAFAARHPRIYTRGVARNIRAYGSEAFAQDLERNLQANPNHADASKYVNFMSRIPYAQGRPEWYQFGLAEKMAKAGAERNKAVKLLTSPVRGAGKVLLAAERGFVTSVDATLQELWDTEMANISNQNLTAEQLIADKENYGKILNVFMKVFRAKSPDGRTIQRAANYVLFSPGMTFSRPAQIKQLITNKDYRGYAGQLIATNVAKIAAMSYLFAAAGNYWKQRNPGVDPPVDGETNPLKGDWGKVKIGKTRYDFMGGDAQFYRTLVRLAVGAYIEGKEIITGEPPAQEYVDKYRVQNPVEVFTDYLKSRETAIFGFAKAMATGKDYFDKPVTRTETLVRGFTWEPIQATFDAMIMDGTLDALLAGSAAIMSAGVQTYPDAAYLKRIEFEDQIADKKYSKKWEDLTKVEQSKLRLSNRKKFAEFEQQIKVEKFGQPQEIALHEQEAAGAWVLKQLSSPNRQLLASYGIQPNVSRYLGEYRLNNKKYRQYQRLVAKNIETGLNKVSDRVKGNAQLLETLIRIARQKARLQVRRHE